MVLKQMQDIRIPFYHTKVWQTCRDSILIRDNFLCQSCLKSKQITLANTVHHIKPFKDFPELALDQDNLQSLCPNCHNQIHKRYQSKKKQTKKRKARIIIAKSNPNI